VSRIQIYDTTLRDGMQGEGMSLSAEEKVRVAHLLDDLGIPLIEAGFPASNPKEEELFARLAHEGLRADVCAFGMTRRRDAAAADDPGLRLLADCFAPVCTLVGKTWSLHLEKVVRVGRDENLRMIADSVAFLVGEGKRVIYDAEHFFDAWRSDREYALACVRAAAEAGAENVTLCDTNGASLPGQVAEAVREVVATGIPVGIHCHNDAECGVANSLAAVAEGAVLVQGTLNGYGERCGNANLTSIVPNLQLKLGHDCLPALEGLTEASHLVADLLNLTPDANQPYVGKNAFAHKGGMHVAGVTADPATFEHIDPAAVGNAREVLVSELAGKGTVVAHAGGDLDAGVAARVVERVKALEHRGFQFEAADGSLDLLIRRETGEYEPLFRLESWRVIAEKREDGKVMTEATIKIWVQGERYVRTAEGNGPVHALDRALREAISETYPHLADIKLVNYKVRILDEAKATAAVTRVLLDASDGVDTWGAIGVHENVIEASWDALVDSLEAGMLPSRSGHRRAERSPASEAVTSALREAG
jgi:2-isopropylmalate synthase